MYVYVVLISEYILHVEVCYKVHIEDGDRLKMEEAAESSSHHLENE